MREQLHDAIEWLGEVGDEVIKTITTGHEEVQIWSDMTDEEIYFICDHWLARARKRKGAAARVRSTIKLYETFVVPFSIFGPRIFMTGAVIKERGISIK